MQFYKLKDENDKVPSTQ